MKKICILLATYNGEQYLSQQIESILQQDNSDWELWIRDDQSTDKTAQIIDSYLKSDDRIHLLESSENLGVIQSFFTLLKNVPQKYSYYMFCDQDDYWLPNKISLTLDKMVATETDKKLPTLIYTDLKVADQNLQIIHESMFDFQQTRPVRNNFSELIVQNVVTGCTIMINQSLKQIFKDGEKVVMHDQWLGLIASAFGRLAFVPKATILYRQHSTNQIGAVSNNFKTMVKKALHMERSIFLIKEGFQQALSFLEVFDERLSPRQKKFLEVYSHFEQLNFKERFRFIQKYQLKKSTWFRTTVYRYLLLRKI